jgi:hypothetical protein
VNYSTLTGFGAFQQDSTLDENSFQSQSRSDQAAQAQWMNSGEKRYGTTFKPTAPAFNFMTDLSLAPVFKPTAFVFNPTTVHNKPM